MRTGLAASLATALVLTLAGPASRPARADAAIDEPAHSAALDAAIIAAAKRHGVPEHLVRRIIMRESKYNPRAHNRAFWGLMQISYPTARSMGFRGSREELLNPFVNLRYAVPYLANAFRIAERREDMAVRLYAAGYYFTARSKGLLNVLRTADSPPLTPEPPPQQTLAANANAQPPQSVGFFGALFSPGRQPAPQPAPAAYAANSAPDAATPEGRSESAPGDATAQAGAPREELPKKWLKDGGVTVIARGEQAVAQMAGHRTQMAAADDDAPKAHKHHSKKITIAADLDVPLTSAPAYASAAQDPRFAAAPSQAAIESATAAEAARQASDAREAQNPAPVAQDAGATPVARVAAADEAKPGPGKPGVAKPSAGKSSAAKASAAKVSVAKAGAEKPVKSASKSAAKATKVARRHKDETRQAFADKPLDLLPTK